MSNHVTWRVKDITTDEVYTTMAKDNVDAMEQVADDYELNYNNLRII